MEDLEGAQTIAETVAMKMRERYNPIMAAIEGASRETAQLVGAGAVRRLEGAATTREDYRMEFEAADPAKAAGAALRAVAEVGAGMQWLHIREGRAGWDMSDGGVLLARWRPAPRMQGQPLVLPGERTTGAFGGGEMRTVPAQALLFGVYDEMRKPEPESWAELFRQEAFLYRMLRERMGTAAEGGGAGLPGHVWKKAEASLMELARRQGYPLLGGHAAAKLRSGEARDRRVVVLADNGEQAAQRAVAALRAALPAKHEVKTASVRLRMAEAWVTWKLKVDDVLVAEVSGAAERNVFRVREVDGYKVAGCVATLQHMVADMWVLETLEQRGILARTSSRARQAALLAGMEDVREALAAGVREEWAGELYGVQAEEKGGHKKTGPPVTRFVV